jgi:hypothetical protein
MSLRDQLPAISQSWNEGKYLDFWSIVHFLSGALMGLVGFLTPFSFIDTFIIAVTLMVMYELWEVYISIGEHIANCVTDVFIGALGFMLSYYVAVLYLSAMEALSVASTLVLFLAIFATVGWRAYIAKRFIRNSRSSFL